MRPADTSPEAWQVYLDIQRRMSPGEKLARVFELTEMVRDSARQALRRRFPQADDREIFLRYARTALGDDLFRRAYGDVLPADPPGEPPAFDLDQLQDEVMRLSIDRLVAQPPRAQ
jgi:hypothetical protein